MKKILLAGVAAAALVSGPALAADMPARMPVKAPPMQAYGYNWSGFYIGGHVGGGWTDKCYTFSGTSEGCHEGDGWLGGGQVGFNWQSGQFVFGLEFSGSAADLSGSHVLPGTAADTYTSEISSIFLLTGRVGVAFDRVLAYVTGGGAWARDRYTFTDQPGGTTANARENRWGWTLGAGLEFALAPNWSLAAQYNYIDFGNENLTFSGTAGTFAESIDQQVHLGTVRLNYRFGGAQY
jgi:outer membrane immunogenic protein